MRFALSLNPVLVKELRGRMRGARAYIILTITLVLMGLVGYGLYRIARYVVQSYGGQQSAMIGQAVFIGLVFFTLGIICFITPALTAGAISGEHERKTFDMLAATPLRPASVLFGKLVASLSYVTMLIVAAVPLVSLSYVFGGVATIDMLQALLLLFGFTLTFGVLGLFFSVLVRRTGLAAVLSYIVLAAFIFGTLFVYGVYGVIRQAQPPSWLLALNPFSAMASALVSVSSANAFSMSGLLQPFLWLLGGGGIDVSGVMSAYTPLWRYTVGIYAWLTVALYIASMILVRPVRRFRLGAPGWAAIGAFVVVSILAVPVVYGPLTPSNIIAWVRWNTAPKRNLVVNGTFTSPLEPAWAFSSETEVADEAGGSAERVADGKRHIVQFSREGVKHAETKLTQAISQTVPQDDWLQLRVVLRIKSHDVDVCGVLGSECPVMIKMFYTTGGWRHYWMQGFYALDNLMTMGGTMPDCTTCEIYQPHIKVPLNEWYTYESPNLIQDLALRGYESPQFIETLIVAAAGHSYEVEVAEVALISRPGRPPNLGTNSWGTPTPVPMMINSSERIVVPAIVLPTEAPVPAP